MATTDLVTVKVVEVERLGDKVFVPVPQDEGEKLATNVGVLVNGWVVAIPVFVLVKVPIGVEQGDCDRVRLTETDFVNG